MRKIVPFLMAAVVVSAIMMQPSLAKSQLPPCPDYGYRNRCFGTLTSADGDKYVGEFKDDNFNGQGTLTFANGDKFVGNFKDDKFNGQGTYIFANGYKYVGNFKDAEFNGQGTLTYADGDKYVVEFKDGLRNGQGTLTFANGDKYVGEFKDGRFNGQGTYIFANGDKYVGNFKDAEFKGQGTLTYADGDKYVGNFKDGKPNGPASSTETLSQRNKPNNTSIYSNMDASGTETKETVSQDFSADIETPQAKALGFLKSNAALFYVSGVIFCILVIIVLLRVYTRFRAPTERVGTESSHLALLYGAGLRASTAPTWREDVRLDPETGYKSSLFGQIDVSDLHSKEPESKPSAEAADRTRNIFYVEAKMTNDSETDDKAIGNSRVTSGGAVKFLKIIAYIVLGVGILDFVIGNAGVFLGKDWGAITASYIWEI